MGPIVSVLVYRLIRGPNLNIYKVTGIDPNHIKHQQLPTQLVKITIIFI